VVISYQHFGIPVGTIFRGQELTPEDGTDRYPETSVRNYHYSLRNDPGERSSLPGNLPTRILQHFLFFLI